jgi:peptide/nickel transport system substrate-binding protein
MRIVNSIRWAAPFAMGSLLLLAACSSSGTTSSTSGSTGGSATTSAGSAGQTVTVAVPGDITDFNPFTDDLIEYRYVIYNTVFDPLVQYTPTLGISPDLATSYSSNANATVWTFNLRQGVKFTDGEPFNAAAAIASLKDAVSTKSIFAAPLATVKSYAAPSTYQLVITLSAPYAAFLDGLAEIAMVAPNTLATASKTPVGTGPFKFVSWTPNSQIVLARNNSYFGAKPAYQSLIFKPVTDPTVAMTDLSAGDVDIVANVPTSATSQVNSSQAKVVQPPTSNALELIEFNSTGKLANPLVRQALAYALDKSAVNKIAYNGLATPTWTPIAPSSFAYQSETGYDYNLTKAKSLLAQAGESHLNLTLIMPTGYPDAQQLGRVWQASLSQIGVTLNVSVLPLSTWLTKYLAVDYDMSWNTFNASADPNSFFSIIMPRHEKDFNNPQFYSEITQGVSVTSQSARAAIYQKLQNTLVSQLPVMIVMRTPILSVISTKVSGYALSPLGWGLFTGVTVG